MVDPDVAPGGKDLLSLVLVQILTWRGERTLALGLILGEAVQGLGSGGVPAGLGMDRGCAMSCVLL